MRANPAELDVSVQSDPERGEVPAVDRLGDEGPQAKAAGVESINALDTSVGGRRSRCGGSAGFLARCLSDLTENCRRPSGVLSD